MKVIKETRAFKIKHLIYKAKMLIDTFCKREYERFIGADYTDLSNVEVAYTTTDDEKHEIRAYINFHKFCICTCIDNVVVKRVRYSGLKAMIKNALPYLDFNELVCVTQEQVLFVEKGSYMTLKERKANMLSKFPVGTRIKLIALQEGEALTLPAGTIGTVRGVDDEPSLLMGWDNGSTLKLYPDGDEYEIIK